MLKEMIETGRSVDAAIDAACEKIGCVREDCEFEIIDLPKKAFFGLKNVPAKVRVWIEVPDAKPALVPIPAAERRPKPQRQNKPPQQKKESPSRGERPQQRPQSDAKVPAGKEVKQAPRGEIVAAGDLTEKETFALNYVTEILAAMELQSDIEIIREDNGICVKIKNKGKGGSFGAIIGHHGETLDAIQYLTGLAVNRSPGDYLRVTIYCGDYRAKRQETLKDLAHRVASQVLDSNVSRTLEPMNPFERRIIHSTVSEIEGVHSISVGEEPARRVVITTPTAKRPSRPEGRRTGDYSRSPRDRGGSGRDRLRRDRDGGIGPGGPRGGPRGNRPPKPPQIVPDVPKATPEAGMEGQLYGKIELE